MAPNLLLSQIKKHWLAIAIKDFLTLACSILGVHKISFFETALVAINALSTCKEFKIELVMVPVVHEKPLRRSQPARITEIPSNFSRTAAMEMSVVTTVTFCFSDSNSARQ